jgi:hypothetical protein
VAVSGIITFNGGVSVVWPEGMNLDGPEYVNTLKTEHIPAVRKSMRGNNFTLIIVCPSHL